jgi:hypothetical protein
MEVRQRGWFGREFELADGAQVLALLSYAAMREHGEVQAADGRVWSIRRLPGFGPWQLADRSGVPLATATKDDAFRDRFTLAWRDADRLRLERRSNFGRRLLIAVDLTTGTDVGRVEQRGFTGRVTTLQLPVLPDEVLALVAWLVGMLSHRDAAAVAAQN